MRRNTTPLLFISSLNSKNRRMKVVTYVRSLPSFLFPLTTRNHSSLSPSMGPNALHVLSTYTLEGGGGDGRARWNSEKSDSGEDAFRVRQLFFLASP